ncbi:hypothetical protein [Nitrosovibrio sp. Nv4]|uniref:hypothetical protein n=1 Tax=Nitrosovibrio sp. Nv4 TaxID=1945880 RepID=UPI000BC9A4F9|nr:hypothetical protein [Nitrosovibrio sp. Nv4]SOD42304.1 hypothetical protein SAMN06298226_2642 [Nitrosovibrio sp. Nv4]
MEAKRKILNLLADSSSQNPMPEAALFLQLDLSAVDYLRVLTELYDARAINRATIHRDGRTEDYLWPTGMISKINYGRQYIVSTPPPSDRKAEAPITKTQEKQMEQTISKTQIMLDLLKKNGSATSKELIAASGAASVKPYLEGYFKRGLIVSEGSYSDKVYSLAPGVKPEDLVPAPRKRATPVSAATSPVEVISHTHSLRRTSAKGLGQEFIGTCVQCGQEDLTIADLEGCPNPIGITESEAVIEAVAPLAPEPEPAKTSQEAPAKSRFRVAITSDQTIMLFGLSTQPIELDREQAKTLAEFVSDKGELLCV